MNALEDSPKEYAMTLPVKYLCRWRGTVAGDCVVDMYFARTAFLSSWTSRKYEATRFKTKAEALAGFQGYFSRHKIVTEPVIE